MNTQLHTLATTVQVISAILMILSVSFQQSDASLGSFSGDTTSAVKYTRRGFEKFLFRFTILLAIIFVASSIVIILK